MVQHRDRGHGGVPIERAPNGGERRDEHDTKRTPGQERPEGEPPSSWSGTEGMLDGIAAIGQATQEDPKRCAAGREAGGPANPCSIGEDILLGNGEP